MATSPFQVSPGVFVNEIDLSQRINTISTTIGVCVGASHKGPVMQRTLITSQKEFLDVFGTPDPKVSFMHYSALAFLEKSSRMYVTRVVGDNALTAGAYLTVDSPTAQTPILRLTNFDDGTNQPLGVVDPFNNIVFDPNDPAADNTLLFVCAIDPGVWNNRISVQIRPSNPAGLLPGSHPAHDPLNFYIEVFLDYQGPLDRPVESFLVRREPYIDGFGNQIFVEDTINTRSNYIRVRNNPYCDQIPVLATTFEFLDGASDGDAPEIKDLMAAWDLYTDTETIDVNVLINGGYTNPDFQLKMVAVAEMRRDCVALLDVPQHMQKTADAITYRKETVNLDTNYATLCTPDVKIYDRYNAMEIFVPPSGYFAQVCAATDANANLWYAPAGLQRGLLEVLGVNHVYNQGMRDALDEAQINFIRFFPQIGYAIWAQNTLQVKSSALSNLNVRRLLNYMEKAISQFALYSVFEPNDVVLRAFIKTTVEQFLQPIKNARGLYDFKVICDDTNNPPYRVASGDLMLDVYVDPVLPSKRIHLNATITKTGALFQEAYANLSASGLSLNNQA